MEGLGRLDKWLLEQERELLTALVSAASRSTDPDVRGIAGRIFITQAVRGEIATKRKEGDE